jgi:hypothetical protein
MNPGVSNLNHSGAPNHCGRANQPLADSETPALSRTVAPRSVNKKGRWRASLHFHPAAGGAGWASRLAEPSPAATPWEGRTTGLGCCSSLTISRISVAVRAVPTQYLGKCQIPLHQGSGAFGWDLNRTAHGFSIRHKGICMRTCAAWCEKDRTALRAEVSLPSFDGGDQKSPMKVDEISHG